jgi:hypothetical protein
MLAPRRSTPARLTAAALERTTVTGTQALPKGKVELKMDFDYQGAPKELGKAAHVLQNRKL